MWHLSGGITCHMSNENIDMVCCTTLLTVFVKSDIFLLSWNKKKQKNKHSNSLIYNLRSFVRSKRKKEWTEAKSVKSFNIWVSVQHRGPPLLLLLYSISSKKKPGSDLLKVVQCESEKIRYLNARQSWHLSPLKRHFCVWLVSIPKSKHNHISYISSSQQGVFAFLKGGGECWETSGGDLFTT